MKINYKAVARAFFGIASIFFGLYTTDDLIHSNVVFTAIDWFIVIGATSLLLVGGGFLAFWRNRLWRYEADESILRKFIKRYKNVK